jgi:hypothetical protein
MSERIDPWLNMPANESIRNSTKEFIRKQTKKIDNE